MQLEIPFIINLPGPVNLVTDVMAADSTIMRYVIELAAGRKMAKTATAIARRIKKSVKKAIDAQQASA